MVRSLRGPIALPHPDTGPSIRPFARDLATDYPVVRMSLPLHSAAQDIAAGFRPPTS